MVKRSVYLNVNDFLWYTLGYVWCFIFYKCRKRSLLKHLKKVQAASNDDMWKSGVRYATKQIERWF